MSTARGRAARTTEDIHPQGHAARTTENVHPQGRGELREQPTTGRRSGEDRDHPSGTVSRRACGMGLPSQGLAFA